MQFIAAMDHSGGSTGSVLERYEQEFTEENKMEKVHAMRLPMVNSPDFTSDNIWAAILYKDTVDKGMPEVLRAKGIESYLKIDRGCEESGLMKPFHTPTSNGVQELVQYAHENDCTGTKMRSIVKTKEVLGPIVQQQFMYATEIANAGLTPIIEPEIPIHHVDKKELEQLLFKELKMYLEHYKGGMQVILKLTIPEIANTYHSLSQHKKVRKLVGLSGGYDTDTACKKLKENLDMSASFSRALSEGLFADQTEKEFNKKISQNIKLIEGASS